jgi:hypothetical protein
MASKIPALFVLHAMLIYQLFLFPDILAQIGEYEDTVVMIVGAFSYVG